MSFNAGIALFIQAPVSRKDFTRNKVFYFVFKYIHLKKIAKWTDKDIVDRRNAKGLAAIQMEKAKAAAPA